MNMQKSHLVWCLLNLQRYLHGQLGKLYFYNKPKIVTTLKKNIKTKIFFLKLTLTWEVKRGP